MDVWTVSDSVYLPQRSPLGVLLEVACVYSGMSVTLLQATRPAQLFRGMRAYKRVQPCTAVTARSEWAGVGVRPVCARICVRAVVSL